MKRLIVGCAAALAIFSGSSVALPVHDAATDFSFVNNPNSVWKYGYKTTLGAAFTAYDTTYVVNGVQFWADNVNGLPSAAFNPSAVSISYSLTTFLSHQLTLHPGANNEYSVLRFTAPTAGNYQLTSSFNMRSSGGTHSTDVHVLLNGNTLSQLYSGTVIALNDVDNFATTLFLAVNDTVDFVVGANGSVPNQSFLGDTTQVGARLEFRPNNQAPVPGTGLLLVAGIALLLANTPRARRNAAHA